jgi:hypothetical protein
MKSVFGKPTTSNISREREEGRKENLQEGGVAGNHRADRKSRHWVG